ncbi:MAG: hypothetical protein A2V90_09210 [Gammaproteobacteria bacterium RBG_16_57_12]|nr:MAG: hypothetical protein A2V90_09210 [Gammaproteobacteria bacterium RBG_16_57_12]
MKHSPDNLHKQPAHLDQPESWHLLALEMMTSLADIAGAGNLSPDPRFILDNTRRHLNQVIELDGIAFVSLPKNQSPPELIYCYPEAHRADLQREVARLTESGEFARSLDHRWQLPVPSPLFGRDILLQPLVSHSGIQGMFIGIAPRGASTLTTGSLYMLTVILHSCAQALESAGLHRIISEQNRQLEATVEYHARQLLHQQAHDPLTGLTNRLLFQDRIEQAILRSQRSGDCHAVLLLDLDLFKRINESFGHSAGDGLLKDFALRLKGILRESDSVTRFDVDGGPITLSRLGGDEFGILLGDVDTIDHIIKVVQRIIEVLAKPFFLQDHEVLVTTSIGISVSPHDGDNPETLLRNADIAMYHAKQQGRNNYQFYAEELNTRSLNKLVLENKLRHALKTEQFILHYQPRLDLVSGRLSGAEALVRWAQPEGGLLQPQDFIPLAEETGLIVPLGNWILHTACRQARAWHDAGLSNMHIAVNLSARQFKDKQLLEKIRTALDESALPPQFLEIEITESAIMEDVKANLVTLWQLRDLGIRLAIDDFGTGYSSLSYLKRFPIDILKIDQSFIRNITHDADDAAIVTAIAAMAHSLGLVVVAEGVETPAHLDFLRKLHCNEAQGFLFSKPITSLEYSELFKTGSEHLIPAGL